MTSYKQQREEFIAVVSQEGLPISVIREILAKATTLQKIAELSCSSEAADRDRVACPAIKSGKDTDCLCDSPRICDSPYICSCWREGHDPTCRFPHTDIPRIERQEARIKRNLESIMACRPGFKLNFQGDPRGAVVKLAVPSGKYDDMSKEGLCVPSRGLPASFWERNR